MLDSDKEEKNEYMGILPFFLRTPQAGAGEAGARSSSLILQAGTKLRVRNFKRLLTFPSCIQRRACGDLIAGQWELHSSSRGVAEAQIVTLCL